MKRQDQYFLSMVVLSFGLFWQPLSTLVSLALTYDPYSHILVIPAFSAFFIYWIDRSRVFQQVQPCWKYSAPLIAVAAALFWVGYRNSSGPVDGFFSLQILAVIIIWVAGFLLAYGTQPFRVALFPLSFLLLMVPLPETWLAWVIFALQQGSADASYWVFRLTGVPVFRDGFYFTLPGLTVEVAEQCSGIRSSTAMLILCLLVGHIVFRTYSRKVLLLLFAIPILIFKNAVRIVTITLLSAYVSRDFLSGWLHQFGGVLFFLLGLLVLVPIISFLERTEKWQSRLEEASEADVEV